MRGRHEALVVKVTDAVAIVNGTVSGTHEAVRCGGAAPNGTKRCLEPSRAAAASGGSS